MAENAFDFRVMEPEQRSKGGKLDLTYWAYHVRVRTTLPQYARKEMEVVRRYSDFEWLRAQLVDEFVWCIVPPIPEKAVQGTIEKFVAGTHSNNLLEYRQRALRKFLIRVGAHPHLYNSQLLQDFCEMDEGEWERRMKAPKKNAVDRSIAAALTEAGSTLSKQWNPNPVVASGASYAKALTEERSTPQIWEESKAYVAQLEQSIVVLKERLEQLVRRRRETAVALGEFGRAFTRVGEVEQTINEGSLANALIAVGKHSEQLSGVYIEQADQETKQVVETLNYYIGMCTSVKETLKRLLNFIAQRDSLASQVIELTQNRDKAVQKGGQPEKVAKLDQEIITTTERRDAMMKQVINIEALFKEELRRFHREKQYDIKSILKGFTELQLDYASKMRRSWEELLPTVDNVKL